MNSWYPILLSGSQQLAENVFKEARKPIEELVNAAVTPLLAVVTALAAIYCILLGAKLAKAEEPQEREKAKAALRNAIVGFVLIFVLLVVLQVVKGPLTNWYESYQKKPTGSVIEYQWNGWNIRIQVPLAGNNRL